MAEVTPRILDDEDSELAVKTFVCWGKDVFEWGSETDMCDMLLDD